VAAIRPKSPRASVVEDSLRPGTRLRKGFARRHVHPELVERVGMRHSMSQHPIPTTTSVAPPKTIPNGSPHSGSTPRRRPPGPAPYATTPSVRLLLDPHPFRPPPPRRHPSGHDPDETPQRRHTIALPSPAAPTSVPWTIRIHRNRDPRPLRSTHGPFSSNPIPHSLLPTPYSLLATKCPSSPTS
jgi:hypothetical protein